MGRPNQCNSCCGNVDQPCGSQTRSGGAGTTINFHTVPPNEGNIVFSYQAYGVPDTFIVEANGTIFINTGSVSGSANLEFCKPEGITTIKVTVIGPNGTAWNYTLGCPNTPCDNNDFEDYYCYSIFGDCEQFSQRFDDFIIGFTRINPAQDITFSYRYFDIQESTPTYWDGCSYCIAGKGTIQTRSCTIPPITFPHTNKFPCTNIAHNYCVSPFTEYIALQDGFGPITSISNAVINFTESYWSLQRRNCDLDYCGLWAMYEYAKCVCLKISIPANTSVGLIYKDCETGDFLPAVVIECSPGVDNLSSCEFNLCVPPINITSLLSAARDNFVENYCVGYSSSCFETPFSANDIEQIFGNNLQVLFGSPTITLNRSIFCDWEDAAPECLKNLYTECEPGDIL